jgi:hypothetical protein
VIAYTLGQLQDMRPMTLTDTTGPPPEVRITTFCGFPPILDDEWVGDVAHREDSDQLYFKLYGRFPE